MSKKIITLEGNDDKDKVEVNLPLTIQDIQNIGQAYAKLLELKQQKVLTVNTEAEVKGLLEYLSSELIQHADELLAAYLGIKQEYEPLLRLLARVGMRIDGIKSGFSKAIKKVENA